MSTRYLSRDFVVEEGLGAVIAGTADSWLEALTADQKRALGNGPNYGGWLAIEEGLLPIMGTYRDADTVTRSNWECIQTIAAGLGLEIGGVGSYWEEANGWDYSRNRATTYTAHIYRADNTPLVIDRARDALVGWQEGLSLRMVGNTPEEARGLETIAAIVIGVMRDYPLIDDMHHSDLEWEENHPPGECFSDYCRDSGEKCANLEEEEG